MLLRCTLCRPAMRVALQHALHLSSRAELAPSAQQHSHEVSDSHAGDIIRAREVAGTGLLRSAHYTWMHETLQGLIEQTGTAAADHAGYAAHVLLGALRVDLLDELLVSGRSPEEIRGAQGTLARRILDLTDPPSAMSR